MATSEEIAGIEGPGLQLLGREAGSTKNNGHMGE